MKTVFPAFLYCVQLNQKEFVKMEVLNENSQLFRIMLSIVFRVQRFFEEYNGIFVNLR